MKNILITGANRGIGLGLTHQLLIQGNHVFATCRQPARADALQALEDSFSEQLTILALDVTDDESVAAAETAVSAQISSLDILINNAGILFRDETFANFDPELMHKSFDVNVVGVMRVATRFAKLLRQGTEPQMINVSSQLGSLQEMERNKGLYSYNASKAALNMVTRKLAHDLHDAGITVIALHPGWVQTDMGGKGATITVSESIQGILALSDRLNIEDTGKFYTYSGEPHRW